MVGGLETCSVSFTPILTEIKWLEGGLLHTGRESRTGTGHEFGAGIDRFREPSPP